jgi:hypothetical protein
MDLFQTGNEVKSFDQLLEEYRALEAELAAGLKRHRETHGLQSVVTVTDDVDASSDFGKLVIWGKLAIQKGCKVSPQLRIYQAKAVLWREEVRQLLILKAPETTATAKKPAKKNPKAGSEVPARSVISVVVEEIGTVSKASTQPESRAVVNTSPVTPETYKAQRLVELEHIYQRYYSMHRGVPLAAVMPSFNPDTDLGQLIIGGHLLRPVQMCIAPHHQQLIDAEWSRLQPDVGLAQQRELQVVMGIPMASTSCHYESNMASTADGGAMIPCCDASNETVANSSHIVPTPPLEASRTEQSPLPGGGSCAENLTAPAVSTTAPKRKDRGNGKRKRKDDTAVGGGTSNSNSSSEDKVGADGDGSMTAKAAEGDVMSYKRALMQRLLG